jgi:hypothetical protein
MGGLSSESISWATNDLRYPYDISAIILIPMTIQSVCLHSFTGIADPALSRQTNQLLGHHPFCYAAVLQVKCRLSVTLVVAT